MGIYWVLWDMVCLLFLPIRHILSENIYSVPFYAGVHATLYFMCVSLLRRRLSKDPFSKFFLCYITLNFIIGSIGNGINCFDNQAEFVDNRAFPGGPEGYEASVFSSFLNVFGATLYIINTWAQDGLLVCRSRHICLFFFECRYFFSIALPFLPDI
jgi:hypothetical protein